ncbi:MAG: efflux RND transporter periplasmic adaptor subunit [Planctomycetes bacterium]|nr:efflux RND transporter periplasmic adaptor subunit [Planctomycetota bacterium]
MMTRLFFLGVALIATTIMGCKPSVPAVRSDTGAVKTSTPKEKPMRVVIEQPASIDAFEETPLVAHIQGYVEWVHVDIGSEVKGPTYDAKGKMTKPGTLLAELSVPELIKELAQKSALVEQVKAELKQAEHGYKAADAHVRSADAYVREMQASIARANASRDRWQSELARVDDLYKKKIVEKQIVDETLNQYESAKAGCAEVKAKVESAQELAKESVAKRDKAKADETAAAARVKVAEADEARVKALADYRFIRAPIPGVVTRRNIHTGHFLQPNASGGPAVLFVVSQTDKLRIHADIPENEAQYMTGNLPAKIDVPIFKDQAFDDKVARTSQSLDAKSRTLRVEIDYNNKDGKLRPGMFANLIFSVPLGERYTLPATAIFTHIDQYCCWRVEAGKAVRTPIKLGIREGQDVEVLKMQKNGVWKAVSGSEEIIVTNLGVVSEGKEVRVEGR